MSGTSETRKGQRGDFASLPPGVHFEPMILPDLQAKYYARRATRLRRLAEGHELSGYLTFAADLSDLQDELVARVPASETRSIPFSAVSEAETGDWLPLLDALIEEARNRISGAAGEHLERVSALSPHERRQAAAALSSGRFDEVPPEIAPFIWAAFAVWMSVLAGRAQPPATGEDAAAEHAQCPVCATPPVASVTLTGSRQGLRYLHCALCDTDWHMVRAKCTNCGKSEKLDYLSFETTDASVRAECCGDCGGYLKVVAIDRDQNAEVVADDLATLALDSAVEEEGYSRTGFNPFALPG